MKTYIIKKSDIRRNWYLIDAKGKSFGRVAAQAAAILRGKHKKEYSANFDMGDFIVITNAKYALFTGKKMEQKNYYWHTGYPGGIRSKSLKDLMKSDPCQPLKRAIHGMLPQNRLKNNQLKRIKIYADQNHKHTQKLIEIN